jgi:hypothetical protein
MDKEAKYRTIMISPVLAKLNGIILEEKISIWLEIHEKGAKVQVGFLGALIQLWTTLLCLGTL